MLIGPTSKHLTFHTLLTDFSLADRLEAEVTKMGLISR